MALAEKLAQEWRSRLRTDLPDQKVEIQESIVLWLLGSDTERFDNLPSHQLAIAKQAMDYRYRILEQRYLSAGPDQAYKNLIQRLSSLFLIRNKIRTWISLSRDRKRTVTEVLQEVIQEMLQNDRHLRAQVAWISECTQNSRLRSILTVASIEEYCLRPIRNQPLLVYRFMNYLRRSQRGGMTQVPTGDLIRLVSEEVAPDDTDSPVSLLDVQAITTYQAEQTWDEQQTARTTVKEKFLEYLIEQINPLAAQWLELYLQGHSQENIAKLLNLPIKQVYRLREKVSYHAIRVFALKHQPEVVAHWLGTSLRDHSLGLTPKQWQEYWVGLTPNQQRLLDNLKAGKSIDSIAQELNLKVNQIMGEWSKLYIEAQSLRSAS